MDKDNTDIKNFFDKVVKEIKSRLNEEMKNNDEPISEVYLHHDQPTSSPYITLEMNGHPITCLIDTGAAGTLLSADVFAVMMGKGIDFTPSKLKPVKNLVLFTDDTIPVLGMYDVCIGIKTDLVKVTTYVTKSEYFSGYDCALGRDFLYNKMIDILTSKNLLRVGLSHYLTFTSAEVSRKQYKSHNTAPVGSRKSHIRYEVEKQRSKKKSRPDKGEPTNPYETNVRKEGECSRYLPPNSAGPHVEHNYF
jgi:hypothetical protein